MPATTTPACGSSPRRLLAWGFTSERPWPKGPPSCSSRSGIGPCWDRAENQRLHRAPDLWSPQADRQLGWSGRYGSVLVPVSYTHLRAHETVLDLVCRLLLE